MEVRNNWRRTVARRTTKYYIWNGHKVPLKHNRATTAGQTHKFIKTAQTNTITK